MSFASVRRGREATRFWRVASFGWGIWIVRSVHIRRVIVAIIVGFIINIVSISVAAAGRWRATIGRFTIEVTFIRAVTVWTVTILICVWPSGIRVTVGPVLVSTIWAVIINIVVRRTVEIFWSIWSFL